MKLKDLAGILSVEGTASFDTEVTGISSDSRQVAPGVVFFALTGTKADGAAYAADAASRGAVAIVAGKGSVVAGLPVPVLAVDDPRLALALSAARYFGRQPQTMVAVTGTSGKTSVAAFTRQIWEQSGFAAASIGTT
ncbi:MAG: UDP-N-acetylmuramoyl-L-alanyl-D-glutamate--2,6-diaminopimelate ligase, partial [Mesorhizobium sp.]